MIDSWKIKKWIFNKRSSQFLVLNINSLKQLLMIKLTIGNDRLDYSLQTLLLFTIISMMGTFWIHHASRYISITSSPCWNCCSRRLSCVLHRSIKYFSLPFALLFYNNISSLFSRFCLTHEGIASVVAHSFYVVTATRLYLCNRKEREKSHTPKDVKKSTWKRTFFIGFFIFLNILFLSSFSR